MKSQLLTLTGVTPRTAESRLREYLQGLDTRLTQVSPNQVILAGPHARALRDTYSKSGASAILLRAGVVKTRSMSEAEVVAVLRARDSQATSPSPNFATRAGLPEDWYLDNTRTRLAWQIVANAPDAIDWLDVQVGQVDTGYTRHPAFGFEPAPWINVAAAETYFVPHGGGPVDPPPEPGKGVDPLTGAFNPGHGTKSGSTIVGRVTGDSYYGIAPGCPVVPVRICDTVLINDRQNEFALAVNHLLDSGVSVITVCLGIKGGTTLPVVRKAVDLAYERGVIMVCAAGQYVGGVVSPARLPRTIAVAGTTFKDVPWSHSCHGPEVDLSAPAADIKSAAAKLHSGNPAYYYAKAGDGTTFATAMVSGAAALWLLHHREDLKTAYPEPWQKVEAFRQCVKASTRRPTGWPAGFGEGILNVEALLNLPLPAAAELQKDKAAG
jgi:Subtilase family